MGRLKVFPECDSGGDGLRLRALRQVVGELRFQEIAEEATYRFSAALLEMKNAANAQDFTAISIQAVLVRAVALQLGLDGIAKVCSDANIAAGSRDVIAVTAILGRLGRVLDTTLTREMLRRA